MGQRAERAGRGEKAGGPRVPVGLEGQHAEKASGLREPAGYKRCRAERAGLVGCPTRYGWSE